MSSLLQDDNIFNELGMTKLHLRATPILKRDFIFKRFFFLAEDADYSYVRWLFRPLPFYVRLLLVVC